ncbi:DUF421 domain-containing protein [Laceyella putida]|uniref:DUF421 domain-containing protein n=1 Tax=Laceyella putida TaxID=110101 RepID=A0ABW2RGW9_9BACL
MSDNIEVIIRTFVAFILLWSFTCILGKQTIAQKTYHGFIASITLGTIAGNMAFNIKINSWHFVISLLIMSSIIFLLALIALRNRKARKWISGEPTVVIENGKILEHNMKKLKYTLDSLNHGLREKDIFNIEEVEVAMVEIDGSLSVLKKPHYRHITKKDLSIVTPLVEKIPVELIMDGEIVEKNLIQKQLSTDWLFQELLKRGLNVKDVCYAVMGTNGQLYFDLYNDRISKPIDQE